MLFHKGRLSRRRRICISLTFVTALFPLVQAVSLSDFSPAASNLTPSCENKAYTVTIPGCTASDFGPGNGCSSSCLSGLVHVNQLVYQYCQSTQDYQLLIAEFRNGDGIEILCPGVVVVTSTPKHSEASQPPRTSEEPTTKTSGTSAIGTHTSPTGVLTYDTSKSPTPSYPITNITPYTSGRHRSTGKTTTITSTSYSTLTSTSTKYRTHSSSTFSRAFTNKPITTDTSPSPTVPQLTATPYSSSLNLAAQSQASASKCIDYGGDPFSTCSNTYSSNAQSFFQPLPWTLWLGTVTGFILWGW